MSEPVDLSKIKKGDELTIRCLAHESRRGGWSVRALHEPHAGSVLAEHILSHTPKALAVGDWVTRSRSGSTRGQIKHVIDGRAWVDWTRGQQLIHQLSDLERLDG